MALINCPECNNKVSTSAKFCPKCGFLMEEYISSIKNIKKTSMNMEFTLNVDDVLYQTVNGIKIDIADLLQTNNFNKTKSAKTLNSITKIGIVQAKNIIDDFLKENPEYDKEKEYNIFIKNQSDLSIKFSADARFDKIFIDYKNKLFKIGFWSYTYLFSDVQDVDIVKEKRNIFVIIKVEHEYLPNIKIKIPKFKNLKKLNNISNLKNIILSEDEAVNKANLIKDMLIKLKNL